MLIILTWLGTTGCVLGAQTEPVMSATRGHTCCGKVKHPECEVVSTNEAFTTRAAAIRSPIPPAPQHPGGGVLLFLLFLPRTVEVDDHKGTNALRRPASKLLNWCSANFVWGRKERKMQQFVRWFNPELSDWTDLIFASTLIHFINHWKIDAEDEDKHWRKGEICRIRHDFRFMQKESLTLLLVPFT